MATPNTWQLGSDTDDFLGRAGVFLHSRPVVHTVLLTLTNALRGRGVTAPGPDAPLFGTLSRDGEVRAAFARTPQQGLVTTPLSAPEVAALVARLLDDGESLQGMSGDRESVEALAEAWQQSTGAVVVQQRNERLYALDALKAPHPAPAGRARVANSSDRTQLARWAQEYTVAIGEASDRDFGAWAEARLAYGGVMLWENAEGRPVSMAGSSPLIAGQVRIAPVYTPSHLRGHGYASAVTAAVTQAALNIGADNVLLFTDLANPTSNALYQRLGYRPVADFMSCRFTTTQP
ncbi:GNAT family N-acetyltransferase (plasmid) [Kitasatospora purpeofusca]|uniref:GNAT family N-acetyltransferase n=1 Tax=Kitasatospora purpeofusca TaxID=67352 RepID=UPI002E13E62A|nr:GNAT family N-acetyltransferase [Kitasatospora purpeofusca]WSR45965.1 GNAT family N-acetyltransferase [Kitasatospora purpeofusca]